MTDSNEVQPSQKSLEDIKEINDFGKWLQKAKFEPGKKEETENCTDNDMPAAAKPLLDALGFKVPILS